MNRHDAPPWAPEPALVRCVAPGGCGRLYDPTDPGGCDCREPMAVAG